MENIFLQNISVPDLINLIEDTVYKTVEKVMENNSGGDEWLTVNEARKLFNPPICRNTLMRYAEKYDFAPQRFHGKQFFSKQQVLKKREGIIRGGNN